MVDFRYHLVSIVAVFLALAVGIVVGTTALNGPVLTDLNQRVTGLSRDKRGLESDLRAAQQRASQEDQALRTLAPVVAAGRLADARVVVVSAPEAASDLVDQLTPLLTQAGATVVAQVRLRPELFQASNTALVQDLLARVAVPGAQLPDGTAQEQALAQLSSVLVTGRTGSAPSASTVQQVLAAYQAANLIDVQGQVTRPGSLALLLVGAPPSATPSPGADETPALNRFARDLDADGEGAVVAGPTDAAQAGGVLGALRADASNSNRVSTVDGADTALGQLSVVLALREQRSGGAGAYGSGTGSAAVMPQLTGS